MNSHFDFQSTDYDVRYTPFATILHQAFCVYDFIPGQRCISDAESQMGLGTILKVEHRTVTVLFLSTGETRTYARETAPLTRVAFRAGDTDHQDQ